MDRLNAYSSTVESPDRWVVATVIAVSGSVPRPIGTSMAVRDDTLTIGSISGGCVESAIVDAALTAITDQRSMICEFGFSDESGLSVGLMCGGDISVLIEPLTPLAEAVARLIDSARDDAADDAGALIREIPLDVAMRGGELVAPAPPDSRAPLSPVTLGPGEPLPQTFAEAVGTAAAPVAEIVRRGGCGIVAVRDETRPDCPTVRRLFVESRRPRARVLIYGANDFSTAIAQAASLLGLHVTVCDARPVFATRARHPGAHEVVVDRPGEHFARECAAGRVDSRTAVIVLTHDPRFDLPVLDRALRMDLAYVGAMGSRTTHERRAQELVHGGLPQAAFDALHSPIGLDIGARTPQEVAVAVLAELIAVTTGRATSAGIPELRHTTGPIHRSRASDSDSAAPDHATPDPDDAAPSPDPTAPDPGPTAPPREESAAPPHPLHRLGTALTRGEAMISWI
nr:XdhC family protein [Brevibacterium sp. XM4083]